MTSQERRFSERQASNYERELNQILEKHKSDMKALELTFMDARHDLERSMHVHTVMIVYTYRYTPFVQIMWYILYM